MRNNTDEISLKNIASNYTFGLCIMLSGFFFGFTLTEFNNFFEHFMIGKFENSIENERFKSINSNLFTFVTIGGFLCALTSSLFISKFSIKRQLILHSCLHIASRVLQLFVGLTGLYITRFVIGWVICFNSFINPIYLADLFPKRYIGALCSSYVGFMSAGIIIASFMKYPWTESYWQIVILIPAFLDLIRIIVIGLIFNIESPKTVIREKKKKMMKNRIFISTLDETDDESVDTYIPKDANLNKNFEIDYFNENELFQMVIDDPRVKKYLKTFFEEDDRTLYLTFLFDEFSKQESKASQKNFFKVLTNPGIRLQLFLGLTINALNQLTGINAINFYSKIIFEQLQFQNAETLTILAGKKMILNL